MFVGVWKERWGVTFAWRCKEIYLVELGDRRNVCMVVIVGIIVIVDLEEQRGGEVF